MPAYNKVIFCSTEHNSSAGGGRGAFGCAARSLHFADSFRMTSLWGVPSGRAALSELLWEWGWSGSCVGWDADSRQFVKTILIVSHHFHLNYAINLPPATHPLTVCKVLLDKQAETCGCPGFGRRPIWQEPTEIVQGSSAAATHLFGYVNAVAVAPKGDQAPVDSVGNLNS